MQGFGYAVLRKLHDITSASVSDKDITLVAAADQFRKKCEAIRILQNRIRRELTEGSVGEDHLNNVLVRRNENKVFTRQIWNDCHGSGIAAQIHRSPDLDTVRIEGRNEGLVRDDNIPIDEIDGYRYRCRDGDERSLGSTRADSRYRVSAILCHQELRTVEGKTDGSRETRRKNGHGSVRSELQKITHRAFANIDVRGLVKCDPLRVGQAGGKGRGGTIRFKKHNRACNCIRGV